MLSLKRSSGVSGGAYQSVMITPPNGSAEASGMNAIESSEARHRNEFTPMPPPASSFFLPLPNKFRPSGPKRLSFFLPVGLYDLAPLVLPVFSGYVYSTLLLSEHA